jgi:SpoIID/LytB domain protein
MSKVTDATVADFLAHDHDAWCSKPKLGQKSFRWTERKSVEDLSARLAIDYPEIGRVKSLTPKKRGVSGRIGVITIKGDKGSIELAGDLKIRRALGGLKSSLFTVRRDGDVFVFEGAGFGHGVGMCQMGAIGMAQAGRTPEKILGHYYRGTHLHRLY